MCAEDVDKFWLERGRWFNACQFDMEDAEVSGSRGGKTKWGFGTSSTGPWFSESSLG